MRRLRYIIPMLMMLLCMVSCERRPFSSYSSKVDLKVNINTDILYHEVSELPSDMVVQLYDPETGKLVYTDYVGSKGGYIHPLPGTKKRLNGRERPVGCNFFHRAWCHRGFVLGEQSE